MAKLVSIASGNFSSSSTWAVINEQSFQGGIYGGLGYSLTTTATQTGTFSPSTNISVSHIGIRLVGTGQGGTMTFDIFNVTSGAAVANSQVTVNRASLNFNFGSASGSYYLIKLPTTISLTSGTNYSIRVAGSSGVVTTLVSNSNNVASTLHRFLVTTTTQAPAATDDLWVVKEIVTGSTTNEFTVTMDITSSATTYGSGTAGFGGISLNEGSKLIWGTSASTNYYLRLNGNIWLSSGAWLEIGTSASIIPSTSTAILEFSGASQGFQQNGTNPTTGFSTYVSYVSVRGENPTYPYALLAADVAANAISATTNVSTGWKSGDTIVIAGTNAVATGQDLRTLTADTVGTTMGFSALTNAHGGSGDVVAEVVNLTRNVKIRNSNASQGVMTLNNVLMDIQGCEIRNMGAMTITGAGIKTFKYNSFYNSNSMSSAVTGVINLDYNCFYNCNLFLIGPAGSTASASTINFNYFILATQASTSTATSILINPKFTDFIGNIASGLNGTVGSAVGTGSLIFYTPLTTYTDRFMGGIVSANTVHSSVSAFGTQAVTSLNVYDCTAYRISSSYPGFWINSSWDVKLYNCNFYGNISTYGGLVLNGANNCEIINSNFRAGTTLTQTRGVYPTSTTNCFFRNCTFGTGQTHSAADVVIFNVSAGITLTQLTFENCLLNSPTKFSTLTNLFGNSFVKLQRYQQTNNNHYIYTAVGNAAQYDGVIYKTGTASTRLIPLTTTFKHKSPVKIMPVASGQTPTVSVWVRKSISSDASGANYNGAQPRLMLGYSPSVFNYTGQTDQVLATMSVGLGTWEQLTATIPYTAYSTGGFEIYVDCDGTTGWINVDDWSLA
jgi:hypothetical protein